MTTTSRQNRCLFHVFDGLREGLTHFSQPSRVALVYTIEPDDPVHIYDPQYLLRGHEPMLKKLYLDTRAWRWADLTPEDMRRFEVHNEPNLHLTGLISYGGRSRSLAYQMWFTEHHPDMCSTGPTERWLEHAVWLLSQDMANIDVPCLGTSEYVLREYAAHAVRDHIVDSRSAVIGWDTQIRVYPILDSVLGISETFEEGSWPRGELVFVEPGAVHRVDFIARFPYLEQPNVKDYKHVRKLLLSVEGSGRKLVSDGKTILGIAVGAIPKASIVADFRGGHGFVCLDDMLVCSFFDGRFHSSTRKAKLVQVEETLLESDMDPDDGSALFKILASIVHYAQERRFGCTLVVDLNKTLIETAGQHLEKPLDLRQDCMLELAKSLSRVDGALHIGRDLHLHGFACLLDGQAVPGENRARGARFNSALRFTAQHPDLVTIVVSADRPSSVIQGGMELTAQCDWKPLYGYVPSPPTLVEYIK